MHFNFTKRRHLKQNYGKYFRFFNNISTLLRILKLYTLVQLKISTHKVDIVLTKEKKNKIKQHMYY